MVTKQKIIEAAFDEFAEKGYHAVSIANIAKRVGISKSTIFHHFKSKQDLAITCFEHMIRKFLGNLEPVQGLPIKKQIKLLLEEFTSKPKIISLMADLYDLTLDEESSIIAEVWSGWFSNLTKSYLEIFERNGIKKPHIHAMLLISTIDGLIVFFSLLKRTGIELDLEEIIDELIGIYNLKE